MMWRPRWIYRRDYSRYTWTALGITSTRKDLYDWSWSNHHKYTVVDEDGTVLWESRKQTIPWRSWLAAAWVRLFVKRM